MAREDPKAALEGDLAIAGVGLVIVVLGSLVVAGGIYSRTGTKPSAPHPLIGTIIALVGAAVVLLGLVLGVANLAVYMSARRKNGQQRN